MTSDQRWGQQQSARDVVRWCTTACSLHGARLLPWNRKTKMHFFTCSLRRTHTRCAASQPEKAKNTNFCKTVSFLESHDVRIRTASEKESSAQKLPWSLCITYKLMADQSYSCTFLALSALCFIISHRSLAKSSCASSLAQVVRCWELCSFKSSTLSLRILSNTKCHLCSHLKGILSMERNPFSAKNQTLKPYRVHISPTGDIHFFPAKKVTANMRFPFFRKKQRNATNYLLRD